MSQLVMLHRSRLSKTRSLEISLIGAEKRRTAGEQPQNRVAGHTGDHLRALMRVEIKEDTDLNDLQAQTMTELGDSIMLVVHRTEQFPSVDQASARIVFQEAVELMDLGDRICCEVTVNSLGQATFQRRHIDGTLYVGATTLGDQLSLSTAVTYALGYYTMTEGKGAHVSGLLILTDQVVDVNSEELYVLTAGMPFRLVAHWRGEPPPISLTDMAYGVQPLRQDEQLIPVKEFIRKCQALDHRTVFLDSTFFSKVGVYLLRDELLRRGGAKEDTSLDQQYPPALRITCSPSWTMRDVPEWVQKAAGSPDPSNPAFLKNLAGRLPLKNYNCTHVDLDLLGTSFKIYLLFESKIVLHTPPKDPLELLRIKDMIRSANEAQQIKVTVVAGLTAAPVVPEEAKATSSTAEAKKNPTTLPHERNAKHAAPSVANPPDPKKLKAAPGAGIDKFFATKKK